MKRAPDSRKPRFSHRGRRLLDRMKLSTMKIATTIATTMIAVVTAAAKNIGLPPHEKQDQSKQQQQEKELADEDAPTERQ